MWKEMTFLPAIEIYDQEIGFNEIGIVHQTAQALLLEFVNTKKIKIFEVSKSYQVPRHDSIKGDTWCYQIFYYDSSARNRQI